VDPIIVQNNAIDENEMSDVE